MPQIRLIYSRSDSSVSTSSASNCGKSSHSSPPSPLTVRRKLDCLAQSWPEAVVVIERLVDDLLEQARQVKPRSCLHMDR